MGRSVQPCTSVHVCLVSLSRFSTTWILSGAHLYTRQVFPSPGENAVIEIPYQVGVFTLLPVYHTTRKLQKSHSSGFTSLSHAYARTFYALLTEREILSIALCAIYLDCIYLHVARSSEAQRPHRVRPWVSCGYIRGASEFPRW